MIKQNTHKDVNIKFAIITVSTSRYRNKIEELPYKDESREVASHIIKENKCSISFITVVPDEISKIREKLYEALNLDDVSVTLLIGGSGIANSDVTYEAIKPLYEKEILGFGEIFRAKSVSEIGLNGILGRVTFGLINKKIVLSLPGSPNAVKTGIELLFQVIEHIQSLQC